jgi:hypothetical protein
LKPRGYRFLTSKVFNRHQTRQHQTAHICLAGIKRPLFGWTLYGRLTQAEYLAEIYRLICKETYVRIYYIYFPLWWVSSMESGGATEHLWDANPEEKICAKNKLLDFMRKTRVHLQYHDQSEDIQPLHSRAQRATPQILV